MPKFRIVQKEEKFYVQKQICFVWFYETNLNFAHGNFDYTFDKNGMIFFSNLSEAKKYLDKLINSKTKIVYEIET